VNGFEYDTFIPETCGLCGLENHVWRFVKGHEDTWYDFAELEEFAALGVIPHFFKKKTFLILSVRSVLHKRRQRQIG
jgi:hypothetical protein